MASKRALIVDDSKSARAFLSRVLEKYDIDVDTAESAEVAIEYLTRHRPDVIFMDHLMPGMDGFQAVQVIKNDPRTATIPIMMYTSQEGELYLGQARALGAVGVLPKQIRPVDVSKVLYQVGLVADRRSAEQTTFTPAQAAVAEAVPTVDAPADAAAEASSGAPPDTDATRAPLLTSIESTMREHVAELRRFVVANLESQSERLLGDVRAMLHDLAPRATASSVTAAEETNPPPARRAASWTWAWVVATLAVLSGLALGALWWRESLVRQALEASDQTLRTQLTAAQKAMREAEVRAQAAEARSPAPATAAGTAAPGGAAAAGGTAEGAARSEAVTVTELVPYGEVPLAGARLESLRKVVARLRTEGFHGVIEVRSFPGRFCLMGNASEGFSLAPEDSAFARCDVLGNPHDDALSPAQRQSLAFANMAGDLRNASRGALELRVVEGSADSTAVPYPGIDDTLSAGRWNRAAAANNRVEIRIVARGSEGR